MAEKKKSFILYVDRKKELDMLSDEQLGKLFRAIYQYVDIGTEPDFDELALSILFSVFQSQINPNAEKYAETCKKRQQIAIDRERKKREKRNNLVGESTIVHKCIQDSTKSTDTDTVTENNNDIYLSGESSPRTPSGGC